MHDLLCLLDPSMVDKVRIDAERIEGDVQSLDHQVAGCFAGYILRPNQNSEKYHVKKGCSRTLADCLECVQRLKSIPTFCSLSVPVYF